MIHWLQLLISIISQAIVIRMIIKIEMETTDGILNEVSKISYSLVWGILNVLLMLFIIYQVWKISGSSTYWDGAYIIAASSIVTIILSFGFYGWLKKRIN